MELMNLPVELILRIAESLDEKRDCSSLARCNTTLQRLLFMTLYRLDTEDLNKVSGRTIRRGELDTLKLFIAANPQLNDTINDLFNQSVRSGYKDMVEYFLDTYNVDMEYRRDLHYKAPLIEASTLGYYPIVKLLLEYGANPNYYYRDTWSKESPLKACLGQHENVAVLLISYGANPSPMEDGSKHPLFDAVRLDLPKLLTVLLDRGVDVNMVDSQGGSVLDYAVDSWYGKQSLEIVLQRGAVIDPQKSMHYIKLALKKSKGYFLSLFIQYGNDAVRNEIFTDKDSLLLDAAKSGDEITVDILIQRGADLGTRSADKGETALHIAVRKGHMRIVRYLLEAGADPLICDKYGGTVLQQSVSHDMSRFLLDYGANLNAVDNFGETAYSRAIYHRRIAIITLFFERGAELNESQLPSLMEMACSTGNSAMVSILIRHGADPVGDIEKKAPVPLDFAVKHRLDDVVDFLLSHGAHVNGRKGHDDWLPLFQAARLGHVQTITALLKHGADTEIENQFGHSPLFEAASNLSDEQMESIRLLLAHGANPNHANHLGYTALHIAIKRSQPDLIELLMENGANVSHVSNAGVTPLMLAISNGHYHRAERMLDIDDTIINQQDRMGRTALHYACMNWNIYVIEVLTSTKRKHRADPMLKDRWGASPLLMSIRNGHSNVAEHMLKLPYPPLIEKDYLGLDAFDWAARCSDSAVAKLLAATTTEEGAATIGRRQATNAVTEPIEWDWENTHCSVCGRPGVCRAIDRYPRRCTGRLAIDDNDAMLVCRYCVDDYGFNCSDDSLGCEVVICRCDPDSSDWAAEYDEEEDDDGENEGENEEIH